MNFLKHQLANGLEIVAEINPHAVSSALGFFVRAGARDEVDELAGVSHFLEHMAFKGTNKRSADDINRLFDEIGAKYNAYTSEEHTVFHAAVLPEYVPACMDLLTDLLRPTLREEDFETERQVILEEIGMYADSPVWSAYDRIVRLHFEEHPLGNSILGSKESIQALSIDAMRRYHAQRYSPNNIVLAASGKLDFDELVRLAEQHGGHWQTQIAERDIRPNQKRGPDELVLRPEFNQESIYLMGSAPSAVSPLRYAADILSVVVGDDTGSRFYWALVDPGRVESVDMSYHEYEGAGAFIIGATCEPTMTADNLELIREILADVHASGITEDELQQAKSKVAARIVLAAERPRSRLFPVGYNWMYRNEFRSVDEDLADLASVTMEQVVELLETYPIVGMTTVCLGPLTTVAGLDRASSDSLRRAARLNRSR